MAQSLGVRGLVFSRKSLGKKHVVHNRKSQSPKQPRIPCFKKLNFVQDPSSMEEKVSLENKSNVDFVHEQNVRMSNSQASTSMVPKPRYVRPHSDRRTCFSCGKVGHVSYKVHTHTKSTLLKHQTCRD